MADYHAILRRTLDGLGETTPELRAKLFVRARATIQKQLESADPAMTPDAIAAQKAHLEAAIAEIEIEHLKSQSTVQTEENTVVQPAATPEHREPVQQQISSAPKSAQQTPLELPSVEEPMVGIPQAEDDLYGQSEHARTGIAGIRTTLILAIAGLLIVVGGAAALWVNRGSLSEAFQQIAGNDVQSTTEAGDGGVKTPSATSESTIKSDENLAAATTVETAAEKKFDRRLSTDGKEIAPEPIVQKDNTLPSGLQPSPVTTTRIVVPQAGESENTGTAPNDDKSTSSPAADGSVAAKPKADQTALAPVAQKSLLYEEGAVQGQNTVDIGNVVWSLVQEAPADGLPLEPAIRAKVDITKRNLVLLMTIKRNADKGLPASHLIELVFSVPGDFSGGNIDKIQRFVFKQSEEARGEALVGVPATIADGIFLIALNNLPEAVERNELLMKGREWIDIPLGYRTGRRALITIEKGVPGSRVFDQAFAAWENAG